MNQQNTQTSNWQDFADDLDPDYDDYVAPCECGVIGCEECDRRYYENYSDCAKLANGLCMKAGSEECDFECPYR